MASGYILDNIALDGPETTTGLNRTMAIDFCSQTSAIL